MRWSLSGRKNGGQGDICPLLLCVVNAYCCGGVELCEPLVLPELLVLPGAPVVPLSVDVPLLV
jgi:hypothetical protein